MDTNLTDEAPYTDNKSLLSRLYEYIYGSCSKKLNIELLYDPSVPLLGT